MRVESGSHACDETGGRVMLRRGVCDCFYPHGEFSTRSHVGMPSAARPGMPTPQQSCMIVSSGGAGGQEGADALCRQQSAAGTHSVGEVSKT